MQIRNQPSPLAGCLWLYFSLSAKLFSLFLENVESLKEREREQESEHKANKRVRLRNPMSRGAQKGLEVMHPLVGKGEASI